MRTPGERRNSQGGQASVELLGSLPAVLLVVAVAWQLVLAGHTTWLAANAARVAARAAAVGRDPRSAARSALPSHLERGLRVSRSGDRVSVTVALPLLAGRWRSGAHIGASALMERQR